MAPGSGEETGTHARPDQPDVPSFARIGCALNIVLSPQRTAGQARYLCEKGRQFLVCRTRPVPPPAPVGAVQRSWRKRETHLLRVTMMRPERNMPDVPRPSVGCQLLFRWVTGVERGSAPRLSRNHVFGVLYGTSRAASRGSSFSADIVGGGYEVDFQLALAGPAWAGAEGVGKHGHTAHTEKPRNCQLHVESRSV